MAKPIPEGFHTITPHLIVKGAAEAIEFYKRHLARKYAEFIMDPEIL